MKIKYFSNIHDCQPDPKCCPLLLSWKKIQRGIQVDFHGNLSPFSLQYSYFTSFREFSDSKKKEIVLQTQQHFLLAILVHATQSRSQKQNQREFPVSFAQPCLLFPMNKLEFLFYLNDRNAYYIEYIS